MPELLIELFSEEIPARMQTQAARDFERMAREKLAEAGLLPESLKTFAGSRRLTLVADGLPEAQGDRTEERKGPRVGSPDQAIEGFLRSTGLTRDQLTERDGVYFAVIAKQGRRTAEVVAEMTQHIVRNFPWPKSMTWGAGRLRWVRPLKRILCVFDREVVRFDIDGIESGDLSEGHRFMGLGTPFRARDFDEYREALAGHYVVLDVEERKARILEGARTLCFARNLELVEDDGLLEEVAGLSEWPTPILGDMDPAFLDLPPEVIRTSMRTHQKYFAVRRPGQTGLAAHFVTVANIEAVDGGRAIAAGNARVLSARLNDARFFWDEDRKVGLEQRLESLKGVTFHAKLGTMYERVERIEALAREIAPLVGADPDVAARAARLAKADLATGMVGEFPELQGLMGGYYAREKEGSEIADAIRDHYRPQGPNDAVPTAPVSVAVALADKLDTLIGFFAIDEKPTGSKDPYALRRAALGMIRLMTTSRARLGLIRLIDGWFARELSRDLGGFDLRETILYNAEDMEAKPLGSSVSDFIRAYTFQVVFLDGPLQRFEEAIRKLPKDIEELPEHVRSLVDALAQRAREFEVHRSNLEWQGFFTAEPRQAVLDFLADRLKVVLREEGKRHDLVDAVFALGDDDLVRIVARVEALDAFLKAEDGANLLAGYKRAVNILKAEEKKGALPSGKPSRLAGAPGEELALLEALDVAGPKVEAALAAEDFAAAMTALAGLRGPVDAFFEKVFVNSEVAAERDNRLRLLGKVRDAMGRVADFSLISG